MKKLVCLILILILTAALAGCNTGYVPAVSPDGTLYSPDPNNVNFNDRNLTTNFATDNPAAEPRSGG